MIFLFRKKTKLLFFPTLLKA